MSCSGSRMPRVCRLAGLVIVLLRASSSAAKEEDGPDLDVLLLGQHKTPPGPASKYWFSGGFSDGTYGYLVPYKVNMSYSGEVVRFPLDTFDDTESLDLTSYDTDLIGFSGGFTDGDFGFLVPVNRKVVRFSLKTFSNVTVLDVAGTDPTLSVGFAGGFLDGDHGYLVPMGGQPGGEGKIVRFRSKEFSSVEVLDIPPTYANIAKMSGGFSDGEYGYLVPESATNILRFSLVFKSDSIEVLQLGVQGARFHGGFSDGHYGYLLPSFQMTSVVRFSLDGNFSSAKIEVLELTNMLSCMGGFTDGHHGYIASKDTSGMIGRFDLKNFSNWEDAKLDEVAPNITHGYNGGFADRGYAFFVPYNSSTVARIQIGYGHAPTCRKLSQQQLEMVKSYGLSLTGPCAVGQK